MARTTRSSRHPSSTTASTATYAHNKPLRSKRDAARPASASNLRSTNRYAELLVFETDAKVEQSLKDSKSANREGTASHSSRQERQKSCPKGATQQTRKGREHAITKKQKPSCSEKRSRWRPTQAPHSTEVKRSTSMSSISSDEESTGDDKKALNWQQESLLSRPRSFQYDTREPLPEWATETKVKGNVSSSKSQKECLHRRSGSVEESSPSMEVLLPPLRYSLDDQRISSKGAWSFVFGGAKGEQTKVGKVRDVAASKRKPSTDIPPWYATGGQKGSKIVVKLGKEGRSETHLPGDGQVIAIREQKGIGAHSSSSSMSVTEPSIAHALLSAHSSSKIEADSHAGVYAGPTFSAAAPEPALLPAPRFGQRRSRTILAH